MNELLKQCLYCSSYFPYRKGKIYCKASCRVLAYRQKTQGIGKGKEIIQPSEFKALMEAKYGNNEV